MSRKEPTPAPTDVQRCARPEPPPPPPSPLQNKLNRFRRLLDEHPGTASAMFRAFQKPDTTLMEFCRIIDQCRDQCRMMGMDAAEIKDMEEDARTISTVSFESMPSAYQRLVRARKKEWLKRNGS